MSQVTSRRPSQCLPPLREVIASLSLDDRTQCCSPTTKHEFFEVVEVIRHDSSSPPPQTTHGYRPSFTDRHDSAGSSSNGSSSRRMDPHGMRLPNTHIAAAHGNIHPYTNPSPTHHHFAAHTSALHDEGGFKYHDTCSARRLFQHETDQQHLFQSQDTCSARRLFQRATDQHSLRLLPGLCPSLSGHQQAEYKGVGQVCGEAVYLYTGGYYLPTHIDGEPVNAQWGLTKANTPRKRLAAACDRCRQKKTRCDPTPEGCSQCQKARKACQT